MTPTPWTDIKYVTLKAALELLFKIHGWNVSRMARSLSYGQANMRRLLNRYHVKRPRGVVPKNPGSTGKRWTRRKKTEGI